MRQALQPLNIAVFALSAFIGGAIPGLAASLTARELGIGAMSAGVAGAGGLVAVGFDTLLVNRFRWARPLAVFRQVPRDYGHRCGPWRAAARYGIRMGFGPATILVSWVWWVAFVAAAMAGPGWIVGGSLVFALVRALSMYLSSVGVRSGTEMAERSALLSRVESRVVRGASLTVITLSLIAIVGPRR